LETLRFLYLDLLKKSLLDAGIYNEISEAAVNGTYWPSRAFTMIGLKRLNNLQFCAEDVIKNDVEGDFIETGVWRGGSAIFMQGILRAYQQKRKVFVADSFQGVPPPNIEKYPADKTSTLHNVELLKVSSKQVKRNFETFGLLDSNIVFLEGWFKDTLDTSLIEKLAVLRLDGDLYESTADSLNALYHKVSKNGYIIVDDYAHEACRTAVTEFRTKNRIDNQIMTIDPWGVYWKNE
jgi:hypothetical protein